MNRKRVVTTIAAALIALALPLSVFGADGAAIYKAKCASCHGADGSGQTAIGKSMKLRNLGAPEVQKQSDKELYSIIADGKGKMPGYKSKLSEVEINALVAHVRTLARK